MDSHNSFSSLDCNIANPLNKCFVLQQLFLAVYRLFDVKRELNVAVLLYLSLKL